MRPICPTGWGGGHAAWSEVVDRIVDARPSRPRQGLDLPSAAVGVVADVVDQVLEVPVAPSFTRIGPIVRSRLEHWSHDFDLAGRVAVVTGATSGIGLATTRAFLTAGASVEIVARNPAKADALATELERAAP